MAIPIPLPYDWYFNGSLGCRQFNPPAASITNVAIVAAAGIDASKVIHQPPLNYAQAPGSAVVAGTQDLHIVYGATGAVLGVQAAVTGAIATGADRHVTVDVQKSTGAGAFASILSAVIDLSNAAVLRTAVGATIASAGLVAGDILRVVVAVSGAAGAQAQGLVVTVTCSEAPQ